MEKSLWLYQAIKNGPGYKKWTKALQKATAAVALMYREIEATTCSSEIGVDKHLRPARMDYPRLMSEVSKTMSAMPLLEAFELTADDCVRREHNDYLRSYNLKMKQVHLSRCQRPVCHRLKDRCV